MASVGSPALPLNFKPIQHYLKIADEHSSRDQVVSYYCQLYAFQKAMAIDKKTPECRDYLMTFMDSLEVLKQQLSENEAIQSETVGQAYLENYALKFFIVADNKDRAAQFDKNLVKTFYTAGLLLDVMSVFGEVDEDLEKNKKYAKWKAAYIHKCLKNGETPIPGPMGEDAEIEGGGDVPTQPVGFNDVEPSASGGNYPNAATSAAGATYNSYGANVNATGSSNQQTDRLQKPPSGSMAPPTTPQDSIHGNSSVSNASGSSMYTPWKPPENPAGITLTTQDYQKAMKLCKFASSALQYEDSKTAIDNLQKALTLLTTGQES
ncbi:vacuolar protein sorting-associated protein VTA1 homolog [Argonauta hians]